MGRMDREISSEERQWMIDLVLVRNPKVNPPDWSTSISAYMGKKMLDRWINTLGEMKVTPESHPMVVDVGAGNGAVAAAMVRAGWKAENMTCVDVYIPDKPLVEKVDWKYINIDSLDRCVRYEITNLPEEVEKLRHHFDIMMAVQVHADDAVLFGVANYFVKQNGVVFPDGCRVGDNFYRADDWTLETDGIFYRKKG